MLPMTKEKCKIGVRFGKLVILDRRTEPSKTGRKQMVCDCLCDCGGKITLRASSLLYDKKKQCGCEDGRGAYSISKIGAKNGLLTIVKVWSEKFDGYSSKERVCECYCDCGNTIVVRAKYLRSNHKLSCGCLGKRKGSKHPLWGGHGEISATFWHGIIGSAKRRGRIIDFNITIEQGWELFLKQNRKCALSGVEINFPPRSRQYGGSGTASLDRIDSSKGYSIDNIQWVHKDINCMKMAFSQSSFLDWCKTITEYQLL